MAARDPEILGDQWGGPLDQAGLYGCAGSVFGCLRLDRRPCGRQLPELPLLFFLPPLLELDESLVEPLLSPLELEEPPPEESPLELDESLLDPVVAPLELFESVGSACWLFFAFLSWASRVAWRCPSDRV